MKKNIFKAILLFFLTFSSFGQNVYEYTFNEVEIVFELNKLGNVMEEKISIINKSHKDIYIPVPSIKKDFYFFQIENMLNSFFGITNSIRGPYPLGGKVYLKRIKSDERYTYNVSISLNEKPIEKYYFGFDFIQNNLSSSIQFKDDKYFIDSTIYMENNKSFRSKYCGNGLN